MLVGQPPFQTRNIKETYRRIRRVTYRFPTTPAVSDAAKHMVRFRKHLKFEMDLRIAVNIFVINLHAFQIQKIFQIDPTQRPTLAQMRQMPFFTGAPRKFKSTKCILYHAGV